MKCLALFELDLAFVGFVDFCFICMSYYGTLCGTLILMNIHKIPKEWYVSKLSYLGGVLETFHNIKLGNRKGKNVLRIYSNSKNFREVSTRSKKWDESYKLYQRRLAIEDEIKKLRRELQETYGTSYEKEKSRYKVTKNRVSKLNMDFFRQLKDDECAFANESIYQFEGHNFRSRFEMTVAQVASELHMRYKYDCGINLYTKKCYSDLVFAFPEFDRCVCLEIMGLLDNIDYVKGSASKFFDYSMAGFVLGREWFILGADSRSMPNDDVIAEFLVSIVAMLCAEHVEVVRPDC